ncbi:SdpI family protein [Desulforamulus aeronauticus]|uniref:Uncharacterized membrane protein n=1 Tax=Desulforamulus aeronauticus DSM 10349 TaxID=1121421 RepID=A0A1M6TK43_9FIRM|nr:SdpI family protein [Desulforamulus aeronauticus]SHK57276.1 Uncharacterized membrane protein [Desulforamulus aeronauticus DSM 10349]
MKTRYGIKFSWLTLGFLILFWGLCASFYPSLPDQVPSHWNLQGEVDDYSHKAVASLIMPLLPLVLYLGLTFTPSLDPKKQNYEKFASSYEKIRTAIVLVMLMITPLPLLIARGYEINVAFLIKGILALLFVVLGNYMSKIRYNYLVGFRLPWTLANEEVWNKTHRVGGKLMVLGGLLALLSAFVDSTLGGILFMAGIFLPTIITLVYSYLQYQKVK